MLAPSRARRASRERVRHVRAGRKDAMNWEEKYNAIAELVDNYRRERDDAREQLYLTKAELGRWVDRETKAVRERESYQNRVARLEEAIVTSLGQRLEPCMSRHPVTVDMAAGSLFFKIGEAMSCEFQDGDDLLEAVKELVRERDEARADAAMLEDRLSESRAEVERLADERDELLVRVEDQGAELRATREAYIDAKWTNAYRRGAEAMREACARVADAHCVPGTRDVIRALPIPEEP
jgi:uncharacterized coiled-coil DUF342 family protein